MLALPTVHFPWAGCHSRAHCSHYHDSEYCTWIAFPPSRTLGVSPGSAPWFGLLLPTTTGFNILHALLEHPQISLKQVRSVAQIPPNPDNICLAKQKVDCTSPFDLVGPPSSAHACVCRLITTWRPLQQNMDMLLDSFCTLAQSRPNS